LSGNVLSEMLQFPSRLVTSYRRPELKTLIVDEPPHYRSFLFRPPAMTDCLQASRFQQVLDPESSHTRSLQFPHECLDQPRQRIRSWRTWLFLALFTCRYFLAHIAQSFTPQSSLLSSSPLVRFFLPVTPVTSVNSRPDPQRDLYIPFSVHVALDCSNGAEITCHTLPMRG
jgi:hypothetical protein